MSVALVLFEVIFTRQFEPFNNSRACQSGFILLKFSCVSSHRLGHLPKHLSAEGDHAPHALINLWYPKVVGLLICFAGLRQLIFRVPLCDGEVANLLRFTASSSTTEQPHKTHNARGKIRKLIRTPIRGTSF